LFVDEYAISYACAALQVDYSRGSSEGG